MLTEPRVVERAEQPYVGITSTVAMDALGSTLPQLTPEIIGWLDERGVEAAGDPFWRYTVVDMSRSLEIEVGVPVGLAVTGDDRVSFGVLPAGRYATLEHTGHPSELMEATAALLAWARDSGLTFDVTRTEDGERWRSRLEIYHTDPRAEPDMSTWRTDLAFRLADE